VTRKHPGLERPTARCGTLCIDDLTGQLDWLATPLGEEAVDYTGISNPKAVRGIEVSVGAQRLFSVPALTGGLARVAALQRLLPVVEHLSFWIITDSSHLESLSMIPS
jgi:hypothetical protein